MIDIMAFLHQFVPVEQNGEPNYVLSFGDLLTCERQQNSVEHQRDGPTVSKRLGGLIPCIADFHTFGNFLQVKNVLNSYYLSLCRYRERAALNKLVLSTKMSIFVIQVRI